MRVLAGDIGGTKTLLQVADTSAGYRVLAEARYESAAWDALSPMVEHFLARELPAGEARPASACFGIAGPVDGERATTTNLSWVLDAREISRATGIARVRLVNDFQAVGYGLEGLGPECVATLQAGQERPHGPRAVIGAGTGLGMGLLLWQDDHYEVNSSEGGHADFAPVDDLGADLLRWLRSRHGRVSCERALSGPGLANIHAFLCESGRAVPGEALRGAVAAGEDPAAAVTRLGLAGEDALAVLALDVFARIYGAVAGNLALTCLASGGVYVAGGIAPRIIDKLGDGAFLEAFLDKGRMRPLLEAMPVRVVVEPKVGLIGAALVAGRLTG